MKKKLGLIVLLIFILCTLNYAVFAENVVYENKSSNITNEVSKKNMITQKETNEINQNNISINNIKENNLILNNTIQTNEIKQNTIQTNNIKNNVVKNEINSEPIVDKKEMQTQKNSLMSAYSINTQNVSNETDLRYYLELNDGNTYDIYLNNDITITYTIFQVGNKNLYGQGHTIKSNFNVSQISAIHVQGKMSIDNTKFNGNNLITEASNKVSVRNGGELYVKNSSFYGGTQGIHVNETSKLTVENCNFFDNKYGIGNLGIITINSANIYNNEQGMHNNKGEIIINNVNIHDNSECGVLNTGNCTFNNGTIYRSIIGIRNTMDGCNLIVNGGIIYDNEIGIRNSDVMEIKNVILRKNTESGVHHKGSKCLIIGGTFEANQVVYLAEDDKFVNTNSSYPIFEVKPNSYTKGRVLVKTTNNTYANNEIQKVTLTPNSNWTTKVSSSDIVIWKKGTVIVKHLDQDNKEIADKVTINGYIDDNYSTTGKTIYGYNLSTEPSNKTGKITESTINVIYKYTLKNTKVVVNYKDQNGNILETQTIQGKVFDSYNTSSKDIYGYKLITNASNASGTMKEETITVNYIYEKIYGNIKVTIVDKSNETVKIKGATVSLYNNSGAVLDTKVTDANGQVNFTNLEVGKYKIGQTKAVEGYSLADKELFAEINNTTTSHSLTLANYRKVDLPHAGGNGLVYIIIGIVIIVLTGIYINKRKGVKNNEK